MTNPSPTVFLMARQIFEEEKPEDRAWNKTFDDKATRDGSKKPLLESERQSFYRRARQMLRFQRKDIGAESGA